MRKQRKQCENIFSDFLKRFSQISGRRPHGNSRVFFACGKIGLSHRNHRNSRKGQGEEEGDGDPVHLLRNPHCQRGATGGEAAGAATGKGGVAKRHKEFQDGVLIRELLINYV